MSILQFQCVLLLSILQFSNSSACFWWVFCNSAIPVCAFDEYSAIQQFQCVLLMSILQFSNSSACFWWVFCNSAIPVRAFDEYSAIQQFQCVPIIRIKRSSFDFLTSAISNADELNILKVYQWVLLVSNSFEHSVSNVIHTWFMWVKCYSYEWNMSHMSEIWVICVKCE